MRVASVLLAVALAAVALFVQPAAARIGLTDVRIIDGVLMVTGHTRHRSEMITLDNRIAQYSDEHARFAFRMAYHPRSCSVVLRTASEERWAAVRSCGALARRSTGSPRTAAALRGLAGSRGAVGERAQRGPAGPQGPGGQQGVPGPQGAAGAPGSQGPPGIAGPPGPSGAQGQIGPPGPVGAAGPLGQNGPVGPQGVAGPAGPLGPAGPQGIAGPAGPAGAIDPQGPKGDTSATRIRQVRQDCSEDRECAVTCADDEIAVNAFCPKRGAAIMTSLHEISCGTANPSAMVALCAK